MHNKTSLRKASASVKSFDNDQMNALMQLFKIAPTNISISRVTDAEMALEKGLVFLNPDGEIMQEVPMNVFQSAVNLYGNNKELFNQTFYNSFAKVRDADPMELLFDQLLHYMTTYGAEAVGVRVPTYIPAQALTEIPEAAWGNKNFKFVVIQFQTNEDCVARLDKYLTTLTAPSPAIREAIELLLPFVTIDTDDIKSFEIQVMQHTRLGTVPRNPVSQLRYLVFVTTGQTLIIKNRSMREMIKNSAARNGNKAVQILCECEAAGLASIFLRFKPIFLAFKTHQGCAPLINRLRRLADEFHRPLDNASLQNLTAVTDPQVQARIISQASNRDLIKVLNSIRSRIALDDVAPGVYSIRNGRTFVKEDGLAPSARLTKIGRMIHTVLVSRLRDSIGGRTFFMPEYIDYTVPTTEKQFVGNIPYGSRINGTPDGAFTIGIQWFNQKGNGKPDPYWDRRDGDRVDIDLHMNSATTHFGWNAYYADGSDIIYTGDLTDAPLPHGAAEAFWFNPSVNEQYIVTTNLYAGPADTEYQLFMTEVKPGKTGGRGRQGQRYTYNPNEALFPAIPLRFRGDERAETIGMFSDRGFYFYGGTLSNGIVPTANYKQFLEGLTAQLETKVLLRDLIAECGGFVITNIDDMDAEEFADVTSLAPEDITVETLFNIVDGIVE